MNSLPVFPPSFTVMIAGIGGQGVMLTSRVLATAGSLLSEHVCRTESRGLSQRGGSVWSLVRFGSRPLAPVSGVCSVDLVIALDCLEAARAVPSLKVTGTVVCDRQLSAPLHLSRRWSEDAVEAENTMLRERVERGIAQAHHAVILDAQEIVQREGTPGCANVLLLGAAAVYLPMPFVCLEEALRRCVHKETLDSNLKALKVGAREAEALALAHAARPAV